MWTGDRDQCVFFLSSQQKTSTALSHTRDGTPPVCMLSAATTQKCLRMQVAQPQWPLRTRAQGIWTLTAAGIVSGAQGGQGARVRDSLGLSHTSRKKEGRRRLCSTRIRNAQGPPPAPARNPTDFRLRVGHTATPDWRADRGGNGRLDATSTVRRAPRVCQSEVWSRPCLHGPS